MANIPIHTLYWPNMNGTIVESHRACSKKLGLGVTYTEQKINHANWMSDLAREDLKHHEAIIFMDIDCLAYSKEAVDIATDFALRSGSFLGLAQAANHIAPPLPVYAAPSFLVISKEAYAQLGQPHLRETRRMDAAQNLSVVADARGFPYRTLYPFGYHDEPAGGYWRMGSFGTYGIGTEYSGGFFHLFQGRETRAADLFRSKAEDILAGKPQNPNPPFACQPLTPSPQRSTPTGRPWRRRLRYFAARS